MIQIFKSDIGSIGHLKCIRKWKGFRFEEKPVLNESESKIRQIMLFALLTTGGRLLLGGNATRKIDYAAKIQGGYTTYVLMTEDSIWKQMVQERMAWDSCILVTLLVSLRNDSDKRDG